MSMFTLAISCLTTSNLPWFMDLTFQVPMQYCSLQQQTLPPSPGTSTTRCCFFLWLCLFILSGVISPLFSSSILGPYRPGEFIFKCHIFLPFHIVHEVLKARILKWFAIPFSVDPGITNEGGQGDPSFGSCKSIVNSNAKHVLLYILVGYLHKSRIPGLNTWIFCELLSSFKSWKIMLWKCCTQYATKFGKLSSHHRTGKGQFSFESQRKIMAKNAQTTTQLHSSHTLVK